MDRLIYFMVSQRRVLLGGIVIALLLALPFLVFADDVSNDLDAVAEVMPLASNGPTGSTKLYIVPQNDDGKQGCNLTGQTTLVVGVNTSNPSVATVSPSSITFTSCGDTPTLTVTPLNAGPAVISLSLVSNNTAGTFNLDPATFIVNVAPPPNTPPTVVVTGITEGAEYEIGAVPAAGCSVTDAEDGPSTFPATLSAISGPLSAYGLGSQSASCSYTDQGGLNVVASEMYTIVDTTEPEITLSSRTAANAHGWNNGPVTVTWSCSDSASGVVASTITETVSSEGAGQSVTGVCEDRAGNTTSHTESGINIDTTAPEITLFSRTPAPNGNGWNNSAVTVEWSCTDSVSGPVASSVSKTVNNEGADQSVTGMCEDLAGNTASHTESGIQIDMTAPTNIAFTGNISDGDSYFFGNVPTAPNCTAEDALSGLASCSVSGYATTVGTHTLTATAIDNAENTDLSILSYTVLAWTLSGFYSPVDMTPAGGPTVWNTVKNGSTVPLKFEVFAAAELTDVSIIKQPLKAIQSACSGGSEDTVELLASGATMLRYDEAAGQFIYNWQTPKGKAGFCYKVTVETLDGSMLVAYFKLK